MEAENKDYDSRDDASLDRDLLGEESKDQEQPRTESKKSIVAMTDEEK